MNTSLSNHVQEMKYRLYYLLLSIFIVIITLYHFNVELIYFCVKPLMENTKQIEYLIYTNITEAFFTSLLLIIFCSLILNIFLLIYHIYFFLIPSLYKNEKIKLNSFCKLILINIIITVSLCYIYFIPMIWNFFLSFEDEINSELFNVTFQGKTNEYISFMIQMIYSCLICSHIPIIFIFFLEYKILTNKVLIHSRNICLVMCCILGALFSPPDIISQLILALPLYVFYELIIIYDLYLSNKNKICCSND